VADRLDDVGESHAADWFVILSLRRISQPTMTACEILRRRSPGLAGSG
jgi:hypothetical protein